MIELNKDTELTPMENLTEILNDGYEQCYFGKQGFTLFKTEDMIELHLQTFFGQTTCDYFREDIPILK